MTDRPLSEVERVNLLLDRLELDVPRAEPFALIGQTLFPIMHALLDRIEDLESISYTDRQLGKLARHGLAYKTKGKLP